MAGSGRTGGELGTGNWASAWEAIHSGPSGAKGATCCHQPTLILVITITIVPLVATFDAIGRHSSDKAQVPNFHSQWQPNNPFAN